MLDKERVEEAEINVKGYLRDGMLKKRVLDDPIQQFKYLFKPQLFQNALLGKVN